LLRVKADVSINYIQDVDILGVTEHNLYNGIHSESQVKNIVKYLLSRLRGLEITSKSVLLNTLTSKQSKNILNKSLWFEAKNGTSLKPSFDYIVNGLMEAGYQVRDGSTSRIKPIGYHSQFITGSEKVNPYTNLKLILDNSGNPIAYLKGKYFRPPELPRRCKEESYVGLTLKYRLIEHGFEKKVPFPLIMFIDMPNDYTPPPHAIRQIQAFGWKVAFNKEEVLNILIEVQNES
jgi:hypothetical protein